MKRISLYYNSGPYAQFCELPEGQKGWDGEAIVPDELWEEYIQAESKLGDLLDKINALEIPRT